MAEPPISAAADCRVVLMTAPSPEAAERIVRTLVEERLAACGNIVPAVTSIYRWQGEVRTDAEALVTFKTTAAAADALVKRALELHPYEVPELLVLPVEAGLDPYLRWVAESTGPNP